MRECVQPGVCADSCALSWQVCCSRFLCRRGHRCLKQDASVHRARFKCLRCPVCFLAARDTVSCCAAAVHSSRSECGHSYHTPPSCFPRHDVSAGLCQNAHLWRSTSLGQNASAVPVAPCVACNCSAALNKAANLAVIPPVLGCIERGVFSIRGKRWEWEMYFSTVKWWNMPVNKFAFYINKLYIFQLNVPIVYSDLIVCSIIYLCIYFHL